MPDEIPAGQRVHVGHEDAVCEVPWCLFLCLSGDAAIVVIGRSPSQ